MQPDALSEKREKFCQNYVLHRNATKAAAAAGYSETSSANQGYRLLQDTLVQERIKELTNEISTDVDVIKEIEKQYEVSRNAGHSTTALKALELLSRVRGNNSDTEDITYETIEADIKNTMQILGFDTVFNLLVEAFPEQFEQEEEEELLLSEEFTSTTNTETSSNDDT